MAIPTFNDGDPIDASVLANLAQEVARLQASIPSGATSGSQINITNKLADFTIPTFIGGRSEKITLTGSGSWQPFTIIFPKGTFTKTPNAITLTPYSSGTSSNKLIYMAQVVKLTPDSAECKVRSVSGSLGVGDIYMYYIAVQNA